MANKQTRAGKFSRRDFLATTGAGLAATTSLPTSNLEAAPATGMNRVVRDVPKAPYDTIRSWLSALEASGAVLRAGAVDQDRYEGTALMYRLVERFGLYNAPVVVFDKVRINGEWLDGPVVSNLYGHVYAETLLFGQEPVYGDNRETFRRARDFLDGMLEENELQYPEIPPVEVSREDALCKQVVLDGDDIDVTRFPFLQNNPGDSGRFLNTTSVVTSDPEMGVNYGTYRCQINGPRTIIIGSGEGQTGHTMFMAARDRGEKTVRVALVCAQDPMTWLISGARIPERRGKKPVDELATAGGLRGKALEVVKCDTNELQVPAHAEMIIEGIVSLESFEPNGPYGESTGYIGDVYEQAFPMEVIRVTHRKDPWFYNDFTGITRPLVAMPGAALTTAGLRRFVPSIVDYRWQQSVTFISIKKTKPGEALDVGKGLIKLIPIFKIMIMVDEDVDLWDSADLFMAFATRWQAYPASYIFEELPSMPLEPSAPTRGRTSKIVIDATRQLPEEGGPEVYPAYSRHVLEEHDGKLFEQVDRKFAEILNAYEAGQS